MYNYIVQSHCTVWNIVTRQNITKNQKPIYGFSHLQHIPNDHAGMHPDFFQCPSSPIQTITNNFSIHCNLPKQSRVSTYHMVSTYQQYIKYPYRPIAHIGMHPDFFQCLSSPPKHSQKIIQPVHIQTNKQTNSGKYLPYGKYVPLITSNTPIGQ